MSIVPEKPIAHWLRCRHRFHVRPVPRPSNPSLRGGARKSPRDERRDQTKARNHQPMRGPRTPRSRGAIDTNASTMSSRTGCGIVRTSRQKEAVATLDDTSTRGLTPETIGAGETAKRQRTQVSEASARDAHGARLHVVTRRARPNWLDPNPSNIVNAHFSVSSRCG